MTGEFWWTILVDCVRVGVKARTEDEAYRTFIGKRFPRMTDPVYTRSTGRLEPPKRSECSIRQSLPVEVEAFERRHTRLPLTQDTALFDAAAYGKVRAS